MDDLLESVPEPPVPPSMDVLSPALRTIAELFEIDEMLIQVAAEASSLKPSQPDDWLPKALSGLPDGERDAFLLRLAQGEPHLSTALNWRLRALMPQPRTELLPRRTGGQLLEEVENRRERKQRRRTQDAEAKRI